MKEAHFQSLEIFTQTLNDGMASARATSLALSILWALLAPQAVTATSARPCVLALDAGDALRQGCGHASIVDLSGRGREGLFACCPDPHWATLTVSEGASRGPVCTCEEGAARFRCAPGEDAHFVALEHVNDDYCDCESGSDEIGTSACSGVSDGDNLEKGFWCANHGFEAKWIPASRVDDGVCDCCDGSDESARRGGTECRDTCLDLRAARELKKAEVQKVIEEGKKTAADAWGQFEEKKKLENQKLEKIEKFADSVELGLQTRLGAVYALEEKKYYRSVRKEQLAWARVQARRWRLRSRSGKLPTEEDVPATVDSIDIDVETEKPKPAEAKVSESVDDEEVKLSDIEVHKIRTLEDAQRALAQLKKIRLRLEDSPDTEIVPLQRYLQIKEDTEAATHKPISKKTTSQRRKQTLLAPLLDGNMDEWRKVARLLAESLGVLCSPVRGIFELYSLAAPASALWWIDEKVRKSMSHIGPARIWFVQTGLYDLWLRFWDAGPTLYFYLFYTRAFEEEMVTTSAHLQPLREIRDLVERIITKTRQVATNSGSFKFKDEVTAEARRLGVEPLLGECLERNLAGYKYSLCLFQSAKQGPTSLGKFESWSSDSAALCVQNPQTGEFYEGCAAMKFTNGQKCWSGPKRELTVLFSCAVETQILEVDEPSTCSYTMLVSTPLACGHLEEYIKKL